MHRLLFFTGLFLPLCIAAQVNLKKVKKESSQQFAYKVSAAAAEQFILKDSIDIDAFVRQDPAAVFPFDSVDERKLPVGQYVIIGISDNRVVADLIGVSNLYVYPINNEKHVQLLVINKNGDFLNDAQVWVNGKSALISKDAQAYQVKQRNPRDALIKVYAPHDTLFSSLTSNENRDKAIGKQRWDYFKATAFARTVSWLPRKIVRLFRRHSTRNSYSTGAKGMMILNQPKYKKTDTVKCKAYVFDKKWRTFKKPVNIFLEYYATGKNNNVFLQTLAPSSPGSFVFQFPLSDTLPADVSYNIVLRTKDNKQVIRKNFRVEDYLLEDISSYNIRSSQDTYYPKDTIHFYTSALDANGLPVLDGAVKCVMIAQDIKTFYPDSAYVPDTLFQLEKRLLTTGETVFDFATDKLPDADLSIKAVFEFKNGNNELQQKEMNIVYNRAQKEFKAFVENDSVVALYRENGKIRKAQGLMQIHNNWEDRTPIQYPAKLKIDPLAGSYSFFLLSGDKIVDTVKLQIENRYEVELSRINRGDTLGFTLNNPYRIPVTFSVFDGNSLLGSGKSSEAEIKWTTENTRKRRAYKVVWQYYWRGEESIKHETVAVLYKMLKINVESNDQVFPGQKDTLAVSVKDYKDRPAADVNLTAVSYNNQLSRFIDIHEPPYLVNYNLRPGISGNVYEQEDKYIIKKYPLGLHSKWITRFGLDSMPYYGMLFPKKAVVDMVTPITEFLPQVSVHVVQKGERKEIYLLYINRQLVYYNGVTEKMNDAFQSYLGFAQIGIRLYDRYIEIDSVYTQPFYKHDLFFDVDKLPANSTVTKLLPVFSDQEKQLLEHNIWRLDNDYRTNEGYIWQHEKLVRLSRNIGHIVGPFRENDSLHFFAPDNFDIHFLFESGYQYQLSKKMARLERIMMFPDQKKVAALFPVASPEWILGDTLTASPVISYREETWNQEPFLETLKYGDAAMQRDSAGKLYLNINGDSILRYTILYPSGKPWANMVFGALDRMISGLAPGEFTLMLVDKNWKAAVIHHIIIKPDQTRCLRIRHAEYLNNDFLIQSWQMEALQRREILNRPALITPNKPLENLPLYQAGGSGIYGKVIDRHGGNGIPGAMIMLKGSRTEVNTQTDGSFEINNIRPGKCTLVITSVGYMMREITLNVMDNEQVRINIPLDVSSQALNEVVVTGYGVSLRKELTGSVTVVNGGEMFVYGDKLQGKVAGISLDSHTGLENEMRIQLRGLASNSTQGQQPIFVIDGIIYDKMPANISQDMIVSISLLKEAEAVALFGVRGSGGAMVISTNTKKVRAQFRDYAFWQPELFTDRDGRVKFSVEYPDNITGWQTYVLAMDKKRRIGKSYSFVRSYKPLAAQITLPQFLIQGDTAEIIGKALNYSNDNYSLQTNFTIDGRATKSNEIQLAARASSLNRYNVTATEEDSVKAAFTIKTTAGFNDQEERHIPILRKGNFETKGQFWMLSGDTTFQFRAPDTHGNIELYAENNTIDILLDELTYLKKYPYYCMEQTASKLKGLLAEKSIREQLHQAFDEDKTIDLFVEKLQKNQLFSGGWSWWPNGQADLFITNYVIDALLPLRTKGMIETNIRNGLLFLQNQLPQLGKTELLSSLLTLSEANHLTDYKSWLDKLHFDSLTIHQQWQFVKIAQAQHLEYSNELKILMSEGNRGFLGGLHWGEENYHWYNDADASTVLAFGVLLREKNREAELISIIQYFLEQRKSGYWSNTVVSSSVVSALLPYLFSSVKEVGQPAVLTVTAGDSVFSIKKYPFKIVMNDSGRRDFHIHKTGSGFTYLTIYKKSWNPNPDPESRYFVINSYFLKNSKQVTSLTSGEKVTMAVDISATKNAEYVMIGIPIPAGCVYGKKDEDEGSMHKEYLKNSVTVFAEKLTKGKHHFEINLESRYNGNFTLNPTKVSLMYFPTFYGTNDIRRLMIHPE